MTAREPTTNALIADSEESLWNDFAAPGENEAAYTDMHRDVIAPKPQPQAVKCDGPGRRYRVQTRAEAINAVSDADRVASWNFVRDAALATPPWSPKGKPATNRKRPKSDMIASLARRCDYDPDANPNLDDCIYWTGSCHRDGYGIVAQRGVYAHRLSYEAHVGPIDSGNHVCHRCDEPSCINPRHLFQGTSKANMSDASKKGRMGRNRVPLDRVHEIYRLHAAGMRITHIARDLGIPRSTVHNLASGQSRKHDRAAWLASQEAAA